MKFAFHFFEKLSSTNDKAIDAEPWNVVAAEFQTRGRGRFKRPWSSGKGGAWFSIVLPLPENPAEMTFLAGLSVYNVLLRYGAHVSIKWPNDIVHGDSKVCGILTENFYGKRQKSIVGIGLNVNNVLPPSLKNKAISLKSILKKETPVKKAILDIVKEFNRQYTVYRREGFFPILKRWKSGCCTLGRNISIASLQGRFSGKAIDVNEHCHLMVKLPSGKVHELIEGDIYTVS